ncbi:MAG: hypothetical protein IJ192_10330 [Clostridia bacterium]|nr:hypothetical protein [Clostridia bacterium]
MKYYGKIGYGETVETSPGLWEEQITERDYFGDVIRNSNRFQSTNKVNDDLNITNDISIIADPYALEKFCFMRYVIFMGVKWKITNVEVRYPRLILSIGGVYSG